MVKVKVFSHEIGRILSHVTKKLKHIWDNSFNLFCKYEKETREVNTCSHSLVNDLVCFTGLLKLGLAGTFINYHLQEEPLVHSLTASLSKHLIVGRGEARVIRTPGIFTLKWLLFIYISPVNVKTIPLLTLYIYNFHWFDWEKPFFLVIYRRGTPRYHPQCSW